MKHITRTLVLSLLLIHCASEPPAPKEPEWLHGSSRVVDNGYIVYVGQAEGYPSERAQFKAEGQALEDLANECSLIPLGTRVEDRYTTHLVRDTSAYVKVAVEFQECDQARRSNTPGEIKKVANVPFTEQLRRYQELSETGELPSREEAASEIEPPSEIQAPPSPSGYNETTHFYVVRQYVAYQKEIVVLSPTQAYAPGTPARQQFAANVQPAAENVLVVEQKQPTLRTQTWSRLPERPILARPAVLSPKPSLRSTSPVVKPPAGFAAKPKAAKSSPPVNRRKRRRGPNR